MSYSAEFEQLNEIAIIGMACRFPGADRLNIFWHNLQEGVESITFFSDQELLAAGLEPALLSVANYVKAKPVLDDIELFDASFFKINPREAISIDPQQRLFLECAWEAMEHAGYNPEVYPGQIGVYAGTEMNWYLLNNLITNRDFIVSLGGIQLVTANDKDYLSTRVAHKLNLRGPSITVQTACSTSLVAVHLAFQSLLIGESDMALAGGVTVHVPHRVGYFYEEGGIFSPDGHCRAFDAQARGTIFGNGVGIVVLKRLADALRDGDHIHAIIKGSAINNDGSFKVGYTAPSVSGQAAVITEALSTAGVEPETISYVEAHGTGTALGDPIEIAALTQAFRRSTQESGFCAIGSVKTNLGHLGSAAGVASLIKTALALEHKQIPASLNFEQPNPQIDFASTPFYVNTSLREWQTNGTPRRAGVSSFGMGGANAHVILEEAPPIQPSGTSRRYQLLMLSARTETALENMTDRLAASLQEQPEIKLPDVAYTLQVGRSTFGNRRVIVCKSVPEAIAALRERQPTSVLTGARAQTDRPVACMFSGQGAQYVHMGQGLYESEMLFRAALDRCVALLKPHLGFNILDLLYPEAGQEIAAAERLDQTAITQPALFSIEFALATLWQAWGVQPRAMLGHSIGEYVAACLAGVFSLEDALALVVERGRLVQSVPAGSMLSVPLSEMDIQPWLSSSVAVAAVNSPSHCVVSGPTEAIIALEQRLSKENIASRRLRTSHAFHSPMMDPILEPFRKRVRQIQLQPPCIPYISNLTGDWIRPEEATNADYWVEQLRQPVRFSEGISKLAKDSNQVLLEVGPGHTLRNLARHHPHCAQEQVVLASMRHPHNSQDDAAVLLTTLGQMWLAGVKLDWSTFYQEERRLRIPLPTYPFDRERYWFEPAQDMDRQFDALTKKPDITDWFYVPFWKPRAAVLSSPISQHSKTSWLLFSNSHSLSKQLLRSLEEHGHEVITVFAGEQFTHDQHTYTIRPAYRSDYDALLTALNVQPTHILHLWNVSSLDEYSSLSTRRALQYSFYSLLFLAQALGKQNLDHHIRLTIVSNNMQKVIGDEMIHPEKATVLGPCQVIPQEMPQITCQSIDIALPEADSRQEAKLIKRIIAEVEADIAEPMIAYRGSDRLVRAYEPVPLVEAKEIQGEKLRRGGVYLITGGLGGIGLTVAGYLARTVPANLVLITRSRFPNPEVWDQWLATHDLQDATSLRIQAVQELKAKGAEVLIVPADITNQTQMESVIRMVHERFGAIHGVIHAAGISDRNLTQLKTEEAASNVLAPKIYGTLVLEAVLRAIPLDFMVLCSALPIPARGIGQVDEWAANAFMDAFAHLHQRRGDTPIVSVNLDTWANMEAAYREGYPSILPEEGCEVFQRILTHDHLAQIAVCPGHLPALLQIDAKHQGRTKPLAGKHARPQLQTPYMAPRNDVETKLATLWQELLGVEQIGVEDNFFELGGDSLLAIQVINRLSQTFQVSLSTSILFEAGTIVRLALAIAQRQLEALDNEKVLLLLNQIGGLSAEEVQSRLSSRKNTLEGH